MEKSSVNWGQLGGAPVLLYKGLSEHSVRPVLNLLSESSIQLFGATILCTCPARYLPRLPPDFAVNNLVVACGMTVEYACLQDFLSGGAVVSANSQLV